MSNNNKIDCETIPLMKSNIKMQLPKYNNTNYLYYDKRNDHFDHKNQDDALKLKLYIKLFADTKFSNSFLKSLSYSKRDDFLFKEKEYLSLFENCENNVDAYIKVILDYFNIYNNTNKKLFDEFMDFCNERNFMVYGIFNIAHKVAPVETTRIKLEVNNVFGFYYIIYKMLKNNTNISFETIIDFLTDYVKYVLHNNVPVFDYDEIEYYSKNIEEYIIIPIELWRDLTVIRKKKITTNIMNYSLSGLLDECEFEIIEEKKKDNHSHFDYLDGISNIAE